MIVETFRSNQEVYQIDKTNLVNLLDNMIIEMRDESKRRVGSGPRPLFGIYVGDNSHYYRAGRMLLGDLRGIQLEIHADKYVGENKGILSPETIGVINVPFRDGLVEFHMYGKKNLAINPSPLYDLVEKYANE